MKNSLIYIVISFIFQCHLFAGDIKMVKWIVPSEIENHICALD